MVRFLIKDDPKFVNTKLRVEYSNDKVAIVPQVGDLVALDDKSFVVYSVCHIMEDTEVNTNVVITPVVSRG